MKRALIVGGIAVVAADIGAAYLPAAIANFGGIPIGKWLAACVGAYAGERIEGRKTGIGQSVIFGITALAGAEAKNMILPNVAFGIGPVDVTRVAAGAGALYLANRFGVEKAA